MPIGVRVFAVILAVVCAGLGIVMATDASVAVTAWLNSLSRTQLVVFRTLCLFVPVIFLAFVAGRRRRPPRE